MGFEQVIRTKGKDAPKHIIEQLALVEVPFLGFDGQVKTGRLIIHKALAGEIKEIFAKLKDITFPIEMISPAGDTKRPNTTNNTSSFNYRKVAGTDKLSMHSFGRAIDINPLHNPYFGKKGISPRGASYKKSRPGTLTEDSPAVKIFESYGWQWLGRQKEHPDYMHFEKP